MKQNRYITSFLLSVAFLSGCKSSNTHQNSSESLTVGVVYDLAGRGDKAFNDSVAEGIARAEKKYKLKALHVESKSPNDFDRNIRSLIEKNQILLFVWVAFKKAFYRGLHQNIQKIVLF